VQLCLVEQGVTDYLYRGQKGMFGLHFFLAGCSFTVANGFSTNKDCVHKREEQKKIHSS
jgi:hypothetical protein